MKRFQVPLAWIVFALLLLPAVLRAQDTSASAQDISFTPATFAVELRQLIRRLDPKHATTAQIGAARAAIPETWEINTPDRHYSIPSRPLIMLLRVAETNPSARADKLEAASAWLSDLQRQVEAYSAQQGAEDSSARAKAQDILSRREFAGVAAQNPGNLLRQKINEMLMRFFAWLFGGIGRHPIATRTFFWLIVALVVAWLATMLFRHWARGAKLESIEKISSVAFHRPWQEWIRAAREAAARGDFREAVHSTYWAGVTRLETIGALAPDPARTPRESLRVLDEPSSSAIAASAQQRESLAALTASLERVWYGRRAAAASDFQDCLRKAEELGCRV